MRRLPIEQIYDHWNNLAGRKFDDFACLFDQVFGTVQGGFPPYDVERDADGATIISVALAGLQRQDIEVFIDKDVLNIKYDKPTEVSDYKPASVKDVIEGERTLATVFHRGIARRSFNLKFRMMVGVEVLGATMQDGLLRVQLKKVNPEVERKSIEIQ